MEYEPRPLRLDEKCILEMITPGASVLDLGCGDGGLLAALAEEKHARGQGIEIDDQAILECVTRGLNVFHDDIDRGLSEYEDQSFDFVILNQTFQQVRKPDAVLKEALRVGAKAIVGFPNFATLSTRFQLAIGGRVPVTPSLPYEWYDTPNFHFLSILDFIRYCGKRHIRIEQAFYFNSREKITLFPNVFADVGVFLVTKG
jgi:methionine biosynthesis protein MetW